MPTPAHYESLDWRSAHADRVIAAVERVDDDELLNRLKACASELGRTPGVKAFDDWYGSFLSQMFIIRFGSWAEACRRAGLTPNERAPSALFGARKYSDEDVAVAYVRIRKVVGRAPTTAEWDRLRLESEPRMVTIRRRYHNKWMEFVRKMEDQAPTFSNRALKSYRSRFDDEQRALIEAAEGGDEEALVELEEQLLSVELLVTYHRECEREWMLLLGTGGPADRVLVRTSLDGEVLRAEYQFQDWFEPWIAPEQDADLLARFAGLVGYYEVLS